MLLSIKSIAALSLIPLAFAKHLHEKGEPSDFCNIEGPFNRVNGPNANQNIVGTDVVQSDLTPFSDYCPTIAGQVGVPVCTSVELSGLTNARQRAQNDRCPYPSPASQPVDDKRRFRCVSYYQPVTTFSCVNSLPVCRYCCLSDFTPELTRDLIYTPATSPPVAGPTLNTALAIPFKCGSPECPQSARIPGTSKPALYAPLSASYCSSATIGVSTAETPYAGLVENFGCAEGLQQAIVNKKWGCYIVNNLAERCHESPSKWCGNNGLEPFCYYDVEKPFSYPLAPVA